MLVELEIKDFALVEHIRLQFANGLNVLTGETGAGKSIIMDALSLALGGKASPTVIRNGAERAICEATFSLDSELKAWLKQNELFDENADEDSGYVILSREISKTGSKARINGTLVNVALLQELRQSLVTIHAQHEARTLMTSSAQLELLDGLGDAEHAKILSKVKNLYSKKQELAEQLSELQVSEEERTRRLDFSRFQLDEIQAAHLEDDEEDVRIAERRSVLANVAHIEVAAQAAETCLMGGDNEGEFGAIDLIQNALVELSKAEQFDSKLASMCESLNSSVDALEQTARSLRKYREVLDSDPEALADLDARHAQLATIKRKYGPELKDAIALSEKLADEVEKLENSGVAADKIAKELAYVENELADLAKKLSAKRKVLGDKLAKTIQSELADLGMERCRFEIALMKLDEEETSEKMEIGPRGADRVEFRIAPNPGQPLMPLGKIASGGELSRVMLSVKSIFALADKVATVIFDEIETGLSGRILQAMRDKLAKLAGSHQILCITHQPMIAAVANQHIQVSKEQSERSTKVSVAVLDENNRLKALAAMASGQDEQREALGFAKALFQESAKVRNLYSGK